MGKNADYEDEEMTVELELEDGAVVNCAIITILEVESKDYIVLLPLDEDGENEDGEVWFYGYSENPDDPNEEPELRCIEDDDEYEKVADLRTGKAAWGVLLYLLGREAPGFSLPLSWPHKRFSAPLRRFPHPACCRRGMFSHCSLEYIHGQIPGPWRHGQS